MGGVGIEIRQMVESLLEVHIKAVLAISAQSLHFIELDGVTDLELVIGWV